MKILVVDDEALIRTVIKEYCSNNNYEVFEASSGKEALELLLKSIEEDKEKLEIKKKLFHESSEKVESNVLKKLFK